MIERLDSPSLAPIWFSPISDRHGRPFIEMACSDIAASSYGLFEHWKDFMILSDLFLNEAEQ